MTQCNFLHNSKNILELSNADIIELIKYLWLEIMEDFKAFEKSTAGFWAKINGLTARNDLNEFKKFISGEFPYLEKHKYIMATLFIGEHYDFLHHLIFDCGLKREDLNDDMINPISDKLFTIKELLDETVINPITKDRFKL